MMCGRVDGTSTHGEIARDMVGNKSTEFSFPSAVDGLHIYGQSEFHGLNKYRDVSTANVKVTLTVEAPIRSNILEQSTRIISTK